MPRAGGSKVKVACKSAFMLILSVQKENSRREAKAAKMGKRTTRDLEATERRRLVPKKFSPATSATGWSSKEVGGESQK